MEHITTLLGVKDIYTCKIIDENDMSLDHFIPWSFVLHDRMWNLCPVSRKTNSQKGDCLPQLEKHMGRFIELQYKAFLIIGNNQFNRQFYEDFSDIGVKINKHAWPNL